MRSSERRTLPISDHVDSREAERSALEAELFGGAAPFAPPLTREPKTVAEPREPDDRQAPMSSADLEDELFGNRVPLPVRGRGDLPGSNPAPTSALASSPVAWEPRFEIPEPDPAATRDPVPTRDPAPVREEYPPPATPLIAFGATTAMAAPFADVPAGGLFSESISTSDISNWTQLALSPELDELASGPPPGTAVIMHKRSGSARRRRLVPVLVAAFGVTVGLGLTLFALRGGGESPASDGVRVKARETVATTLVTVAPTTVVTVAPTAAPTTPPTEPPKATPTTARRQVVAPPVPPPPDPDPEPEPPPPTTTTTDPPTTTTTEPEPTPTTTTGPP